MSLDLLHLWAQMGSFAKGIVVIMAIMSIYSLTIVFTKLIQLKRSESETRKFAPRTSAPVKFAPVSVAPSSVALVRLAWLKLAPLRSAALR